MQTGSTTKTPVGGTEAKPPRLCLLGCSALDRLAYRLLLKNELGWEVAVEADFAPTSVWAAMRSKPDIVLVDADFASPEALDVVRMVTRLQPATRVLIVGAAVDPVHVQAWSRCRIHGYVIKDAGVQELGSALSAMREKQQYYSEGVRATVRRGARPGAGGDEPVRLSRRESELLPLLANGLTLREAAQRMTVSYKTADSYRTSLLRKLGLRDRVELARYAIRQHIVDP